MSKTICGGENKIYDVSEMNAFGGHWGYVVGLFFILFTAIRTPVAAQSNIYSTYYTEITKNFDFGTGSIVDIGEDWNGFIWVATTNGLFRFDGTKVKRFDNSGIDPVLPHEQVYSLLIDSSRRLIWIGTRDGLVKMDPSTSERKIYQRDYSNPNSIGDNVARKIVEDKDGRIWISCWNRGLSMYRPETDDFKNYFFDYSPTESELVSSPNFNISTLNSFTDFTLDTVDNVFWLGGTVGLVRFDINSEQYTWLDPPGSSMWAETPKFSIIEIFSIGSDVIVGQTRSVYHYDEENDEVNIIQPIDKEGQMLRRVMHVSSPDSTSVLISFRNGLAKYDIKQKQVVDSWVDNSELNQSFGIVLTDSQNNAWVQTSGELVMHPNSPEYAKGYLLEDQFRAAPQIVEMMNDTDLLVLTGGTHFHIFNSTLETWKAMPILPQENIEIPSNWEEAEQIDLENYYLIDAQSLYQLNTSTGHLTMSSINFSAKNPRLTHLVLGDNGELWIASINSGLFRVQPEKGTFTAYSDEFNSDTHKSLYTWMQAIHQDKKGNIWIRLARSFAIHSTDNQSFSNFHLDNFKEGTFKYVSDFSEDLDGNVWIASVDKGIGRTDANQQNSGIIEYVTEAEGLISNRIKQIEFSSDGLLWILSDIGISYYNPTTKDFRHSLWGRGLPHSQRFHLIPNNQIALELEQGGLAMFEKSFMDRQHDPPIPYLADLRQGDRIFFDAGNRIGIDHINLLPNVDFLTFGFSALGYTNPKEFSYFLEGVNNDWITTSKTNSATYSNLSPGTYMLNIRARVEGEDWSDTKRLRIIKSPHWWQTSWIRALIASIFLGLIYLAYRWRLNNVRQKERIKADYQRQIDNLQTQALRSQMNPHFLFNSLNSIQNFIIKNKQKEAVSYLDRFSKLMRLILQNSRSSKILLKDEMDSLKIYLELEALRFDGHFTYDIQVDQSINSSDQEIPPMLIQPFVENAILHGLRPKKEKGKLLISIKKDETHLICTIEDDGVGRLPAGQTATISPINRKSMGMQITQNRLDVFNRGDHSGAAFTIYDLKDEMGKPCGTRVIVTIPL